jgi:hypothetical protein
LAAAPAAAVQVCRAELRAVQERQTKMHRFDLRPERYLAGLEAHWASSA